MAQTLNRLTSGADTSHWGEGYTYDNWGNMTQLTVTQGTGNAFSVSASTANQLSNLSYDLAGNVTHDEFGNTIAYTAESRIASSGSASYTYDGDGNRVVKTDSAGTTLYWPTSVSGIIDESNSAATAFAPQVYLGGLKVWSSDTAGNGRFLFQDHLGSTRVTANSAGTVLDDIDYRSYGNIVANYGSAPSENHYTFTGYESDATDTSTNYATFRNQTSYLGRFHSPDPYLGSYDFTNPQSLNRYTYTLNNPLAFVDPLGLDYIDDISGCSADGRPRRKSMYCCRWCSTRTAGDVLPLPSMVTKTENCLCASHPIVAGMVLSYLAQVALS